MRFSKAIVKQRIPILVIALLLMIPSVWGMISTRVNYDMLDYLPQDMDTVIGQGELLDEFGKGAFSILILEDMNDKDVDVLLDRIAELGLKEGDWCFIETPFGKCRQRLHITICIDPRITHAMHGWWFPEEDPEEPHLFGNWRSSINTTMPHHVNGKLGYGDCFKSMICKVYKDENQSDYVE